MLDPKATPTVETQVEPTLSIAQFNVVAAEISVIEKRANRLAVLVADDAARLHAALEVAITSEQVSKDLIVNLRDKLAIQAEASLVAILCANLSLRLEGDLKAEVKETI
jgi:hypothetical protein